MAGILPGIWNRIVRAIKIPFRGHPKRSDRLKTQMFAVNVGN